jgi:chemotaxis signal transduction protein
MYEHLLLTVSTARHRYIVRRDQIGELRTVKSQADLEQPDDRGRSILHVDMGQILDPQDATRYARCHALVIPMRRRSVALLIERIEDASTTYETLETVQTLPPLLAARLAYAWFSGVVIRDDIPLLVLDVRQIARDMLLRDKKKA